MNNPQASLALQRKVTPEERIARALGRLRYGSLVRSTIPSPTYSGTNFVGDAADWLELFADVLAEQVERSNQLENELHRYRAAVNGLGFLLEHAGLVQPAPRVKD